MTSNGVDERPARQGRTLHFRLTAGDGRPGGGGISSADTALVLAPSAGPFLETVGNVFFDLNDADFVVRPPSAGAAGIL